MFVLHSDCSNLFKKCRYCCSEESTRNNDQTSDSQQVQPTPEQPSTETLVDESNFSTDSSENPTDDVVLNNDDQAPEQHLSSTTSSSSNPNDIEVSTNVPEKKKQRDVDYIAEEEAEASVIKAATSSLISDEQEGDGVVAVFQFLLCLVPCFPTKQLKNKFHSIARNISIVGKKVLAETATATIFKA